MGVTIVHGQKNMEFYVKKYFVSLLILTTCFAVNASWSDFLTRMQTCVIKNPSEEVGHFLTSRIYNCLLQSLKQKEIVSTTGIASRILLATEKMLSKFMISKIQT